MPDTHPDLATGRNSIPPITSHDIDQIRSQVHGWLQQAHARSQATGKPLLILVGEHHGGALSALLTTVIYQEAHHLGIRDVAFEIPATGPTVLADRAMLDTPISRLNFSGHSLLNHLSHYNGDTQHFVDGRHLEGFHSPDLALARRNGES